MNTIKLARRLVLAVLALDATTALAQRYTSFDVPGGTNTRAFGINSFGQVVGRFDDVNGVAQGFLRHPGGRFETLSVPGAALGTWAQDINDFGDVVGRYFDADNNSHGFVLRNGVYQPIDFPGALETTARGIDNLGRITGNYFACTSDSCIPSHPDPLEIGFVLDRAGFHTIFFPGADSTDVWDEVLGTRVGDWSDLEGNVFGYVERGGVFTNVNVPASSSTSIRGINVFGVLVGVFGDADGNLHGFARVPSGYVQLDAPDSSATFANRINLVGTITGFYFDANGDVHGYVLTDWKAGPHRSGPLARPLPQPGWRKRR